MPSTHLSVPPLPADAPASLCPAQATPSPPLADAVAGRTTAPVAGTQWVSDAPPAILDLEASGFGRDSYPIEIGYVLPDGQTFCSLIKPAESWTHWDPSAEHLHHITRASAVRHGRSASELARELNQRLAGHTLYSDGWLQDYTWLNVLYEEAGLAPSFKLGHLRTLLTEAEAQRWDALKQEVERELKLERHRASSDARLLQTTLLRLRQEPHRESTPHAAPA